MRRFERDYQGVFSGIANEKKAIDTLVFEHRVVGGSITWKGAIDELKNNSFNSFDLIVNNSNYTPQYLKSIYVIEYYKILIAVQCKVEKQIELSKNKGK